MQLLGTVGAGGADEHANRGRRVPAQRGGAGHQCVVPGGRLGTAHDRVDDERFEPRVPCAARLGGPGVHRGGRERDLAPEPQHPLHEQSLLVLVGGERGEVLFEHVGRDTDELDGLAQRQPPREVARRGAERLGSQPDRLAGLGEPGDEVGDTGLRDEQDAGPLVGADTREPGLAFLHRRQAGRSQPTGGELQAPQGRCGDTRGDHLGAAVRAATPVRVCVGCRTMWCRRMSAGRSDLGGLRTLLALLDLEPHALTLIEVLYPLTWRSPSNARTRPVRHRRARGSRSPSRC